MVFEFSAMCILKIFKNKCGKYNLLFLHIRQKLRFLIININNYFGV